MENRTTRHRDAFHTEYIVRGDDTYIDAEIRRITDSYPPAGYDTTVVARGVGWAKVVHDNSCD